MRSTVFYYELEQNELPVGADLSGTSPIHRPSVYFIKPESKRKNSFEMQNTMREEK
jgi:hypothetical protein